MNRYTLIVGEAGGDVDPLDLLQEQVLLVQEENHRRVEEPGAVTNGAEQLHRLDHSILKYGFVQGRIDVADGESWDNAGSTASKNTLRSFRDLCRLDRFQAQTFPRHKLVTRIYK